MRAAAYIIEKHHPNLLLVHLLLTDSVQHQYGAQSLAANTALILADRQLQRILDAVDRAGIRDQTTLFVVSDHGFKTYHHLIHPNAILRAQGFLRIPQDCDGWVIPEGGQRWFMLPGRSAGMSARGVSWSYGRGGAGD